MTLWKGKHERRKNPFQKITLGYSEVLPSLSSPIKLLTLFHLQREDRQEMIRAVAFVPVPSINKHFWTETHSSSPTVILSARTLNNLIACIPLLTRRVCERERKERIQVTRRRNQSRASASDTKTVRQSGTEIKSPLLCSVFIILHCWEQYESAAPGSRNWPERVDWWCVCHCFLSIINSLFHRSAMDIILPCTVAQCWSTQ